MNFNDLLEKDVEELQQLCANFKKEHMGLRFLLKTAQNVKTSALRTSRKTIARIKTRLRQLELNK